MGPKNIYLIASISLLLLSFLGGLYLIKTKQEVVSDLSQTIISTPTDLPTPTIAAISSTLAPTKTPTPTKTIIPTKTPTVTLTSQEEPSPTRISIPEAGVDFPFKGLALIGLITTLFGILVLL